MPTLSVIVPVLNERDNVELLVERLARVLVGIDWEVVFVDDDSLDGTADVARSIAQCESRVRIIRRIGRLGLASAAIEGMMATSSRWLAVMDGDLQHDEALLPQMLNTATSSDLDLVVASRNMAGGSMGAFSSSRIRLSNLGRSLTRLFTTCNLSDPMSGFFLISRPFLDEVVHDLSQLGFKILLDIVISSPRPIRYVELPFTFRTRAHGDSKLDTHVSVDFLLLLADKLVGRIIPVRYVLYSLVGLLGVIVNLAVLLGLTELTRLPLLTAQLIGTIAAMTSNYFVNNTITYRDAKLRGWRAMVRGYVIYAAACGIGALINVSAVKVLIEGGRHWLFAAIVGVIISSIWNYGASNVFTWKVAQRRRTFAKKMRAELSNIYAKSAPL